MAASIFRLSSLSCGRMKFCIQATPQRLTAGRNLLIPVTSGATHKQVLHTSPLVKKEKPMFELPKNTKEGYTHWKNERIVSVALLAMIPAAMVYPNVVLDHGFALLAPLHMYWGVKAIIGDYLPRAIVPATKVTWLVLCVMSTLGLLYINVNDVGVTKLFGQIMSL